MAASTNPVLDVLSREHARLAADVDRCRARFTQIVAALGADAAELAGAERIRGAEAVDTSTITQRIRELNAAKTELMAKTAELADRTKVLDSARQTLGESLG